MSSSCPVTILRQLNNALPLITPPVLNLGRRKRSASWAYQRAAAPVPSGFTIHTETLGLYRLRWQRALSMLHCWKVPLRGWARVVDFVCRFSLAFHRLSISPIVICRHSSSPLGVTLCPKKSGSRCAVPCGDPSVSARGVDCHRVDCLFSIFLQRFCGSGWIWVSARGGA